MNADSGHALAVGADHVQLFEHRRVRRVLRLELHHDAILVQPFVKRGDLSLAERAVQGLRDRLHVDAEPSRRLAVDLEGDPLRAAVRDGLDVGQLRQLLQGGRNPRRPLAQQVEIIGEQVEVGGTRAPAAGRVEVLRHADVERAASDQAARFRGAGHDVVRRNLALGERLQPDHDARVAGTGTAAGGADDVLHRGVGHDEAPVRLDLRLHERYEKPSSPRTNARDLARVLGRQKAFGNADVERDVQRDRPKQHEQRERRVTQDQRSVIGRTRPAPRRRALVHFMNRPSPSCDRGLSQRRRGWASA
jgi:hypothetical protein